MNELTIFEYKDAPIRTLDDEGVILFCASDVARALGYKVPKDAVAAHCKGAVKHRTLTNGGMQEINFIPESDVYRLIISSKLPTAERFERWVFEEVLPTIRKTGGYNHTDDKLEIARLLASCKSASAVKAICTMYEIGNGTVPENMRDTQNTVGNWMLTLTGGLACASVTTAYNRYLSYCKNERITPVPMGVFSDRVQILTSLKTKWRRVGTRLEEYFC